MATVAGQLSARGHMPGSKGDARALPRSSTATRRSCGAPLDAGAEANRAQLKGETTYTSAATLGSPETTEEAMAHGGGIYRNLTTTRIDPVDATE